MPTIETLFGVYSRLKDSIVASGREGLLPGLISLEAQLQALPRLVPSPHGEIIVDLCNVANTLMTTIQGGESEGGHNPPDSTSRTTPLREVSRTSYLTWWLLSGYRLMQRAPLRGFQRSKLLKQTHRCIISE